ncbi:uncharacterized protein LOC135959829 [Calliphora vicina]|uniref:uncharacterized protein LOC135959829 n=1 Tax=Calliphora vicina TaxID=7373 RepID=UPI00325B67C0
MFTLRWNSYRIFQYLLILFFVSRAVIAGQTPKKCAAFNEYCQNHWDCCSNSCMSYMYRCSRGYNVYPYPFLGVSYKPTVTFDQILEQNFGSSNAIPAYQPKPYFVSRFGGLDEASTTEVQIVLQKKSEETTTTATTNNELTSTLKNPIELPETIAVVENRLGEELNVTQRKDNADVLPTTEAALVTSSTTKPPCSEIGVKCYTNDECCSKRCHGFLHQCVT